MQIVIYDLVIYSAAQRLIKTVSVRIRFLSVPAEAMAFVFKRKHGYKAHHRFTDTFTSSVPGNIELFDVQLTAVSGRREKQAATGQSSNAIVAVSLDYHGSGKRVKQKITEIILHQRFMNCSLAIIMFFHFSKNGYPGFPFLRWT
ncbi:hypothetical protein HA47_05735 [Pantoea stewartii subsp. indologenes]|nr:hypothetical protein HA47_05735 [Pantoea stewartii subsp. indologenes]